MPKRFTNGLTSGAAGLRAADLGPWFTDLPIDRIFVFHRVGVTGFFSRFSVNHVNLPLNPLFLLHLEIYILGFHHVNDLHIFAPYL